MVSNRLDQFLCYFLLLLLPLQGLASPLLSTIHSKTDAPITAAIDSKLPCHTDSLIQANDSETNCCEGHGYCDDQMSCQQMTGCSLSSSAAMLNQIMLMQAPFAANEICVFIDSIYPALATNGLKRPPRI